MSKRAARPPGPRPKIDPDTAATPVARTAPVRLPNGKPKRSPVDVTPETIAEVAALSGSEIRIRLTQRGLHPNTIEDLIRNRDAVGCRWRLIQELC